MQKRVITIAVFLAVFLSGCAIPVAQLEVRSNPAGATATIDNGISGVTPFFANFKLTKEQENGTAPIYIGNITTRWFSGATASTNVNINISAGREQSVLINRPSAPGLETDVNYAVQQQELAAQEKQRQHEAKMQQMERLQQQQLQQQELMRQNELGQQGSKGMGR